MRKLAIACGRSAALLVVVASSMMLGSPIHAQQSAMVTMMNTSDTTVQLFVDGQFRCEAPPETSCSTKVTPGRHNFHAQGYDGLSTSTSAVANIGNNVWTIYNRYN